MTHPELAGFPIVVPVDVAWGDMDSYGHVNNVIYFRYFENARIAYLDRVGWLASMRETGLGPIVASTSARFRKAVAYPDRLLVGRTADRRASRPDHARAPHRERTVGRGRVRGKGGGRQLRLSDRAKVPIPAAIRAVIGMLEEGK